MNTRNKENDLILNLEAFGISQIGIGEYIGQSILNSEIFQFLLDKDPQLSLYIQQMVKVEGTSWIGKNICGFCSLAGAINRGNKSFLVTPYHIKKAIFLSLKHHKDPMPDVVSYKNGWWACTPEFTFYHQAFAVLAKMFDYQLMSLSNEKALTEMQLDSSLVCVSVDNEKYFPLKSKITQGLQGVSAGSHIVHVFKSEGQVMILDPFDSHSLDVQIPMIFPIEMSDILKVMTGRLFMVSKNKIEYTGQAQINSLNLPEGLKLEIIQSK